MTRLFDKTDSIADDWQRLDDDDPHPARCRLLVSLARLRRDGAVLGKDSVALGVYLQPDVDIESLADELDSLALVELVFPSFADGRAFSQARELRERFGFKGDIRASGEVLRDQVGFMLRCGFNQFDLSAEQTFSIPSAVAEIGYAYQPKPRFGDIVAETPDAIRIEN